MVVVDTVELFPLGLPGFALSFVSIEPSSSSVASSEFESACLRVELVAAAVLVVLFLVTVADAVVFVRTVLEAGLVNVAVAAVADLLVAVAVEALGLPRVVRFGEDCGIIAARAILCRYCKCISKT